MNRKRVCVLFPLAQCCTVREIVTHDDNILLTILCAIQIFLGEALQKGTKRSRKISTSYSELQDMTRSNGVDSSIDPTHFV
jgi:hypothetical protein